MNRDKLCPYVNGICEDKKNGIISGYCILLGERCGRVKNYEDCEEYQDRRKLVQFNAVYKSLRERDNAVRNSLRGRVDSK